MGGMVNRGYQNASGGQGFQGLLENPMLMAGLGMLSGNEQGRPFAGMLGGVNAAQNQKEYRRQKQREEQLRQLITKAQPGSPLTTPAPVGSNNWMVPPQFAGTTSAGASQGVSAYVPRETPPQPNIDELAMAFMQFGTPEQQAAGLRILSGNDEYTRQLRLINDRADAQERFHQYKVDNPLPSSEMVTHDAFMNATPEERELWLRRKRASQLIDFEGGGTGVFDPLSNQVETIVSDQSAQEGAEKLAAAKRMGAYSAEARGQARLAWPKIKSNTTKAIERVDYLLNHPGLDRSVGRNFGVLAADSPDLSGDARDFVQALNQSIAGAFIQGREALKGAGHITDFESGKAELNETRIDRVLEPEDFRRALLEYRQSLVNGIEIARQATYFGTPEWDALFAPDLSPTTVPNLQWRDVTDQ